MKIAVPYKDNQVFQHFGHTEEFAIYNANENGIMKSIVSTNGQGHQALADFLIKHKVDALICGGMGPCAKDALREGNIQIYAGVKGDCDEAVNQLLKNSLKYNSEATCEDHTHHHDDHECGSNCNGH